MGGLWKRVLPVSSFRFDMLLHLRSFWVNPVPSPLCGGSRRGLRSWGSYQILDLFHWASSLPFQGPRVPCLCCRVHSCEERRTAPPPRLSSRSAHGKNSSSGLLGPRALSPDASAEAAPLPCSTFPDPAWGWVSPGSGRVPRQPFPCQDSQQWLHGTQTCPQTTQIHLVNPNQTDPQLLPNQSPNVSWCHQKRERMAEKLGMGTVTGTGCS